ncbi:MAG TPA: fumarylacetoacetate hydrolase family protein [Streptosporangiaceae bacterium]|nr:fumarylacetoacetate hydrolase family protein [Streptosporangiaceae bacterium]
MRLGMVRTAAGEPSVAVGRDGGWVALAAVPDADRLGPAAGDLLAFLGAGEDVHRLAGELAARAAPAAEPVSLQAPPLRPAAFRDCSLWEEHLIAAARGLLGLQGSAALAVSGGYQRVTGRPFPRLRPRRLWHEQPVYYKGNPAAYLGDGDTVRWPAYTQVLDYELEIGVVIARDCSDLTPAEALGAVGGFLLVNDFSARDVQLREMVEGLMGPAKSKDFGTAFGSVVVTPGDVLPVLGDLDVEVRVNGQVWGSGSTRGMRHSLADVIAYASAGEPLAAGTVIGLGTIPGCSGIETGRWLSPGDVVELSAGPLGTLRNAVGEPQPWRRPGAVTRPPWSIVVRAGERPDPPADPVAWTPPKAPALQGVLAPNRVLDQVERWEVPGGAKPEDVVFDAAGRLYAGVEDGRIWRWPAGFPSPGAGSAELFADTHGRPLGLEADPRDDTLIVCDAYRGLLRADETGRVRVLADAYREQRLKFTNNAAIAADGTVYFSDSSSRFRIEHYKQDLLEHRPNGRVFAYRPGATGLELITGGLYFPNGVALAPDESFLLVAQTTGYDILRIPLAGATAGRPEPFASNLPGIPDNMSPAGDGSYWVAFPTPRLPLVDRMMPRPAARRLAARLPDRLQPAAQRYGLAGRVGADGQIVQLLHGPAGTYREIVGVRQHDGWLYLGSLYETAVGRVPLSA